MNIAQVIAMNIQDLLDTSKTQVADLSEYLGISRQTMNNYLKASSTVDSVQLVKIAEFFKVPIESLLKNTTEPNPSFLFRSALNYSEAIDDIGTQISEYVEKYVKLAKNAGRNIFFLPEQYNLSINNDGNIIDVNFECRDYFTPKLRLDDNLISEIHQIADEQRHLLKLAGKGAISLIPALISRGINIVFLHMNSEDISGLSVCDEERGCFIFVNSDMTVERQLFTVAHEYGHCVLHRPIYRRKLSQCFGKEERKNLLDSMADCFAGRLICNPEDLIPYKEKLLPIKNNLNEVIRVAVHIKKKLQVSLQSVMMGLKEYDLISSRTLSDFFRYIAKLNLSKTEPIPILSDPIIYERFLHEKNAQIVDMLRDVYRKDSSSVSKEHIAYYLDISENEANNYLQKFMKEVSEVNSIDIFDIDDVGDWNQ